jgi:ACS family hexuronate transporter-like MFS transporter
VIKIPHLRWYVAGLLFLASVINYVDRQALSVVAPVLTKELRISAVEYANILQAFLIAYTIMYVFSGVLTDRFGTRWSLAGFMVWWSVSNALHAFATSAFSLGVFRFLLGAGESGNFMASIKAVSEWYPAKEKAFVNGLVNAGAAVGAIVAPPAIVWLLHAYGWRAAFVITGALGIFWLIPWLLLYWVPSENRRITARELALIREGQKDTAESLRLRWADLLKYPQTWGLMLARVISDPVWWFYLFWLPKYLVEQRGFTMVEMGMVAWMPYLFADIGAVLGGLGSGWLLKRFAWEPLRSRNTMMIAFALMMPVSVWIAFTPSNSLAVVLICLVAFAHMGWKTNLMTMTNDVYPPATIGSVAGIVAFGSGVGATLFTNLTGWIVQYYSYTLIFVIMGFLHPISWLVVRRLVREPIKIEALKVSPEPASVSRGGL